MIGVSLRKFLLSFGDDIHRDMDRILDVIRVSEDRRVKFLLLNPASDQAVIRSERESESTFSREYRYREHSSLFSEVRKSLEYLRNRIDFSLKAKDRKIDAKVYSAAPSCLLVITDDSVYVEQYHYGPPSDGVAGGHIPVITFYRGARTAQRLCKHFEYIWNTQGSQPINEYLDGEWSGISNSAWDAGLTNLFETRDEAERRIKHVLGQSEGIIWLVGISLREFLGSRRKYSDIMAELLGIPPCVDRAADRNVELRCLMLDPDSEQGALRIEREEPNLRPEAHANLYRDIDGSINDVRWLKERTRENCSIHGKLYKGAPTAFIILTTSAVFVEQYHYGTEGAYTKGGRVPVAEFGDGSAMYDELSGHVKYLWDSLSRDEEEWQGRAHAGPDDPPAPPPAPDVEE